MQKSASFRRAGAQEQMSNEQLSISILGEHITQVEEQLSQEKRTKQSLSFPFADLEEDTYHLVRLQLSHNFLIAKMIWMIQEWWRSPIQMVLGLLISCFESTG